MHQPPPPNLGPLVRQARERAGLSREQLARLAGVSPSTLKNVEAGRHTVSVSTLRGLLQVHALALPPDAFLTAGPDAPKTALLNAWIAPGFNPIELYRVMARTLAGAGGHLEQSFSYFDHASAAAWCAIASHQDYAQAHASMPLDPLADAIAAILGPAGLDLIALGPGDGRLETRLAVAVASRLQNPVGRFFLLDISQPLLGAAYQRAADSLAGPFAGLTPVAIQGDFHQLPQYTQLLYVPPAIPRRQVLCLLGGTFGNLDHEVRFVRDSLCAVAPGSLLLLDFPHTFGEDPGDIHRRDPWLAERGALGWHARAADFLTGPLRRYCPAAGEITLTPHLDLSGPVIPGSYTVEVLARVAPAAGSTLPERVFGVFRIRRYRPQSVLDALASLGWSHVSSVVYGREVGYPRTLCLFQRR